MMAVFVRLFHPYIIFILKMKVALMEAEGESENTVEEFLNSELFLNSGLFLKWLFLN
jgi:hypothetical protein